METNGRKQGITALLAIVVALAGAAGVADALQGPVGGVTIIGTRWLDGVPTKVKCNAADGQVLNAKAIQYRVFALVYSPTCAIYSDTDDNDELAFSGPESYVVKSGVKTSTLAFSGIQMADGPAGQNGAEGTMSGSFKCKGTCTSVKGAIVYHRYAPYGDVLFVGTYKARF